MPSNFDQYHPYTGFQVTDPNTSNTQDLGQRYTTKSYLLDVYPNIASTLGARTSPGLWTWGQNNNGQLGNGTTTGYSSPIQIGTLTNWKQVSMNSSGAGIKTDGTVWTWGYNFLSQLGIGVYNINYSSPIQVGSLTTWKQVFCGYNNIASLKTDGTLWMFGGDNNYGEMGNGSSVVMYSSPIQVGALTNWKQVSWGSQHIVTVKTDGTLWTWGINNQGQLGLGTVTTFGYFSPLQVGTLTNWKQVSSLNNFSAAIKTDGTLWAWGNNQYGQLGNGANGVYYSSPIQVGSLTNWKLVSVGGRHLSAIKTDGTLWTCGYNGCGQLGNGTGIYYSSPIQVGALTNWKQVACGYQHVVAVKTDGTLWTWGYNFNGQLGNGTTTTYSSPIQVGSLTNWKQISAGKNNTAAISDGYI